MTTTEAKKELEKLIERYNQYKNDKEFTKNEDQIRKSLIEPFVQKVLGWETEDPSEFKVEYTQGGKRIDCVVCLDGISQYIIEAKAIDKEIRENYEFYNQTINYAHSKDKAFGILTNFRYFIILRCDIDVDNPLKAEIAVVDILDPKDEGLEVLLKFSRKQWIDKNSRNELEAKLNLKKKTKIDELLLDDIKNWRSLLLTNLKKNQKHNNLEWEDEKDLMYIEEEVQRFIDRLIFICFAEDKELYEPTLKSLLADKEQRYFGKPFLLNKIKELFKEYRNKFNSDLFKEDGYCDKFHLDDDILFNIISDLRNPKKRLPYNFAVIDADIIGRAYENFIGHLISGKKRFQEKESIGKRKERGIYYTPAYIVNYIVKNTLGTMLKEKKFAADIRILDPACGSGSFLIRAFDLLSEFYKRKVSEETFKKDVKNHILLKHLYGVDLDRRAVEMAQFNLLLRIAEKEKLPELRDNIRHGDSLIFDKSLSPYAFNWEEEFQGIMGKKESGFDVIIGNPPWVSFGLRGVGKMDKKESDFYRKNYTSAEYKLSTYALFVEKGIKLLREGGYFSFILPDSFLLGRYFSKLRRYILDTCEIKKIVLTEYDVFSKQATTGRNIILVLKKTKDKGAREKNNIEIVRAKSSYDFEKASFERLSYEQKYFESIVYNRFRLFFNKVEKELIEKIEKNTECLGNFMIGHTGVRALIGQKNIIDKSKKSESWKRGLISGSQIGKYWTKYESDYINIDPKLLNKGGWDPEVILNDKILIRQTGDRIYATIDKDKYYHLNNIHSFNLKNKRLEMKYILALLNSRLMSAYYLLTTLEKDRVMAQTDIETLEKLPIREMPIEKRQPFIKLVDKMLEINKKINEFGDKESPDKQKMLSERSKINTEIDELVYKLYGITEEEQKIIEESLK